MTASGSIVDAHQHYWQVGRHGFIWPTPDLAAIHRDFAPEDWQAAAAAQGVTGSVVVQSQSSDADTDWLLDLADRTPHVLGVVGWADLSAPDACARIAALAARPKLRGLRPMLQTLDDDRWIARPELAPAIAAIIDHDLSLDALIFTRHAPALADMLSHHPALRVVVDHGAKPPIVAGEFDAWARAIADLAALPGVHCKISGLLTEAGPDQGAADLARYVDHLVACFGADRLMWGSDWPVLLLADDYGSWLDMADRLTGFGGADRAAFLGGTARTFYRL